ncbi:hypothetical protein NO932_02500 [Pelagibacterium sp. 26DY04]|uniref:hypothetical protein n=1 Tax=Pelagibacterium sp. 26DY04 TaxID=2967130 RepID=UPI002816667B|nr:hypothetical protein [Pelagibacterium sp. 26DY04]WMT87491.1 hypothetical protein NO932_02500 [Pelagibacterium sp. 26DY04]
MHPLDIAEAAKHAVNDQQNGADWFTTGEFAHHELSMVELRLRDLLPENAPQRIVRGRRRIEMLVRNPTLLETTAVFPPSQAGYSPDADQVLRRVRDHTHLGDQGGSLHGARASIGDPKTTPFAILGLPGERTPKRITRYLDHHLLADRRIDVVVVDLTRQSREELGEHWEKRLGTLLEALDAISGRRPAILAVCEDPFTLKAATRALRAHNARLRPRRQNPEEVGICLTSRGFLGPSPSLPTQLPEVRFHADIKDASLAVLRDDLLALSSKLKEFGNVDEMRAAGKALSFVRRVASLPLGLSEALRTADTLFDADDDVDSAVRSMFREGMALADLAAVADTGVDGGRARPIIARIQQLVSMWQDETPVSAKLVDLLARDDWNCAKTLISVPDRNISEVLMGSDRALHWKCAIGDHFDLGAAMDRTYFDRVIVIGPSPMALRTLLISESTPTDVVLLGDAAGAGLLAGELWPLMRLPGFSAVAERATGLLAALKRGGLDEKIDHREAEFKIAPAAGSRDIDLSREGGDYTGERVILHTSGHRIVYRPTSDVLVFSSSEARLFEKLPAHEIEPGDHVLVLDEETRNRIRAALATSHTSLAQLALYHNQIAVLREQTPGATGMDKARQIVQNMREIDPSVPDSEVHNVHRWLTADLAAPSNDGARQPRAARDATRFNLFMQANGISSLVAKTYWDLAIVPTRSYRVQEGFQFNQRVVQFILDPESAQGGSPTDAGLRKLWLSLHESVDEVERVEIAKGNGAHG